MPSEYSNERGNRFNPCATVVNFTNILRAAFAPIFLIGGFNLDYGNLENGNHET